eukprot:SAG31_NODE_756_length_12303_cov_8.918142_6_plen_52_part_00
MYQNMVVLNSDRSNGQIERAADDDRLDPRINILKRIINVQKVGYARISKQV